MTRPKKSPKRRPLNLRKDKRLRLLIHLKVEKKVWLKKLEELCKLCLDFLVGDLDHLQLPTLKKKKKKNLKKQPGKIFLHEFIGVISTVDFRLPGSENVFFGQRAKAVQKQTFSGVSVSTFHYRYNSYGSILGILFLRSIFSEESSESKGYWRESNVDK